MIYDEVKSCLDTAAFENNYLNWILTEDIDIVVVDLADYSSCWVYPIKTLKICVTRWIKDYYKGLNQ